MILLEPLFVNKDFKIIFGTRTDINEYSNAVVEDYLTQIYNETGAGKFVLMEQIHSARFEEISALRFKRTGSISVMTIKDCDGIYTRRKGLALSVKTADCMPVFVIAGDIYAAIHMGWRGAQKRIVEKFIKRVLLKKGIRLDEISIISGPHIMDCCYSVGNDLLNEFKKGGYNLRNIFIKRDAKIFLSLKNALTEQLDSCGIPIENRKNTDLCTSCLNSIFYSHRRGDSGRNISLIYSKGRV